jgi:apolipoprotein N-acyltransferase
MRSNALIRVLLALSSGIALALAFPKFELSQVAWIAFVPLLYAIADRPPREVFGYAWLQGLACYLVSLYWIEITLHTFAGVAPLIAVLPLIALAAVLAVYTGLAFMAAEYVTRRLGIARFITVPIAWTALEWVRSFFPIGFPWNPLGNVAYRNLALIQFAEFTGVWGVSALIMFFNVVVFEVISGVQSRRAQVASLSALTVLMAAALGFGTWRVHQLEHAQPAGEFRVAMIQGNIAQSIKWDPAFLPDSFKTYVDESEKAARHHADLIVWPEAAAAFIFQPGADYPAQLAMHATYRSQLLDLARRTGEPILFGAPALHLGDREIGTYNRAYLVSAEGRVEGFYDKIQLVPFGEYVPMRALFGYFVDKIVVGLGDMIPGTRQTLFEVKGARLAVLICYESLFPDLTRRAVRDGADVLVNITNDAWYGASSAPYQMLAQAAMRSVETHVPMVRVANTGISAIISPTGRIRAATDLFVRRTEIESVAWRPERTVYAIVGDLFAELCFGMLIAALIAARIWPRKQSPLAEFAAGLISTNGHAGRAERQT